MSSSHTHAARKTPPEGFNAPAALVEKLAQSIRDDGRIRHLGDVPLPDPLLIGEFVELCRELVFPGFFGRRGLSEGMLDSYVSSLISRIGAHMADQARSALRYVKHIESHLAETAECRECDALAMQVAQEFIAELPGLRASLSLDVQAAYDGDPAADHTDEVILSYPGVDAVFAYRLANILHRMKTPLIPRIIGEQAHGRTGIDIHPGATIGPSFFVDHGAGVVIGETTQIGANVKIYQGVTLGAKSFPKDERGRLIRGAKRHPTIGDRVTIYAGAVILGGDTVVGDDCIISGGVFVSESVPAGHVVRQKKPELVMRTNREALEGHA